ncbi:hypothetical protein GGI12_001761 [Dipsacomyces acuminosporus]|nr:hypothetical protein GGI12_001761 [Dipsacomyces acuminosporus]
MATQSVPSVLLIKLPRHVADQLQSVHQSEIQLSLGGGDKNISGALTISSTRYDVRYRGERGGAPRVFQGKQPAYSNEGQSAAWISKGRVTGRLTVLQPKHRPPPSAADNRRISSVPNTNRVHTAKPGHPATAFPANPPTQSVSQELVAKAISSSTPRAPGVPQKRPGIASRNREVLRERLLHYLAYAPAEESQIFEKIKAPSALVLDTLASLAKKTGTAWELLPEKYKHVQVDSWPRYNSRVRAQVISNALKAFDTLNLPPDDPDRMRVMQTQRKLAESLESGSSTAAVDPSASAAPSLQSTHPSSAPLAASDNPAAASASLATASGSTVANTAALRSPTVPSLSLPKDPPSAKKKPARSIIAPTLAKKIGLKAPKAAKRKPMLPTSHSAAGSTGADAMASRPSRTAASHRETAAAGSGDGGDDNGIYTTAATTAATSAKPSNPFVPSRQDRATKEPVATDGRGEEGELSNRDALEEGEASSPDRQSSKLNLPQAGLSNSLPKPSGASNRYEAASHMRTSSVQHAIGEIMPSKRRLSMDRKGLRHLRAESDIHPVSDAEADYGLRARASSRWNKSRSRSHTPNYSPPRLENIEGTHSRSHSHNPRIPNESSTAHDDRTEVVPRRPVQVKSRPLQAQALAMSPMMSSPHVPSMETEAAVSRVHERLVQEMGDRLIPTVTVSGTNDGHLAKAGVAPADSDPDTRPADGPSNRYPRGPSLSPVAVLPQPLSPLSSPKIGHAETIEDLEQLQEQLIDTYSEYSQLRIKINGCCAEFESFAASLSAALAECQEARKNALEKRKSTEADREEGEEIPGDGSLATEISLAVDPTVDKCMPDGSRLYWYEAADGTAWLTDSPVATVDSAGSTDPLCRSRMLLPEEANVLEVNRAIADKYAELEGDDVRRSAQRYLQLHEHIERMSKEIERGYAWISDDLLGQYKTLSDELGETMSDDVLLDDQQSRRILTIDSVSILPGPSDTVAAATK